MLRRKFIQQAATAAAMLSLPIAGFPAAPKSSPKLCFSTLGCPEWSMDDIIDFAAAKGYSGIEIRGIKKEMNLPKSPVFADPAAIRQTLDKCAAKSIKIVGLGSSCELHHPDPAKLSTNLDEGKRFIDLAAALGGINVRVFPNNFVPGEEKKTTLDRIAKGLTTLTDYAKNTNVRVLMETHGQVVWLNDIDYVMQQVKGQRVGLIWDFYNMWTVTKESPATVYEKLKPFIYHTHLKDSVKKEGKENYVLFGQGEGPAREALQALKKGKYDGYFSFEWEKLWHPEIAEPALALGDFPGAFKKMW